MKAKSVLNKYQIKILDRVAKDIFLTDEFYFTGGTALSELYLQHRESDDLDFFSLKSFDPQSIFSRLTQWSDEFNYKILYEFIDPTHIYFLTFGDGFRLKIDFAPYPYNQLDEPKLFINKMKADSLRDIAANKMIVLSQRREIKDFVDLYFILLENNFWSIREDAEKKFKVEIDPYLFAGDCMNILDFTYLPKMIKPLNLDKLKEFYKNLARNLGKDTIE